MNAKNRLKMLDKRIFLFELQLQRQPNGLSIRFVSRHCFTRLKKYSFTVLHDNFISGHEVSQSSRRDNKRGLDNRKKAEVKTTKTREGLIVCCQKI